MKESGNLITTASVSDDMSWKNKVEENINEIKADLLVRLEVL